MRKGFTLVELLVVVVVLVTLMSITFRLSSIGADQSARNTAVARLQKLENCLSGYYAAFGTYPPVPLHGSRNYELDTCVHGIQSDKQSPLSWNWFDAKGHRVTDKESERKDWAKVLAACQAQPVDCSFPYPDEWSEYINEVAALMKLTFNNVTTGALGPYNDEKEWQKVQVFKFGLMSFLLPRYLVMMRGNSSLFNDQEQWQANNKMPCDPLTGERFDGKAMEDPEQRWDELHAYAKSNESKDLAHVQNIPSQAACARWMPNLAGICSFGYNDREFFGIDIRDTDSKGNPGIFQFRKPKLFTLGDDGGKCTQGGSSSSGSTDQYVLDTVTVYDGFTRDDEDGDGLREHSSFFYYSPPPYQSYVLWSAGPNGRTFPPWVPRETLDSNARACVGYWTEDDIVILSH